MKPQISQYINSFTNVHNSKYGIVHEKLFKFIKKNISKVLIFYERILLACAVFAHVIKDGLCDETCRLNF